VAKLIIGFDEIGGIGEFNGLPTHTSETLIINKAMDYLMDKNFLTEVSEDSVVYSLSTVDWANRSISFRVRF